MSDRNRDGRNGPPRGFGGYEHADNQSTHRATHPDTHQPHTGQHTRQHTKQNPRSRRKKRRSVPTLFGDNEKLAEQFMRLTDDPDPRLRVYVYPFRNGQRDGAAVYIGEPFRHLLDYLRDEFGSASYYLMFRRGRRMELAGTISICAPLNWRPRT